MNCIRKSVTGITLALAVLMSTGAPPQVHASDVIDRIVATVNGHIILQSDWDEALCYEALLSGRALTFFTEEDRRAVLDRLIDQELLSEQMKSASFQHASETEAATQVAEARKLYPDSITDEGWQARLARHNLTQKAFMAHVRQEIDLMRLVDAHLRPAVQVDSKSIEAYYRDKFVPQVKQSGAGELPLADVSAQIRELLIQEKVSELMVSWLQSLRSESKVSIAGISVAPEEGVQSR